MVERALAEALGDPGPRLCSMTTLLCDAGGVARPLWVSILLAKQGTVGQSHSSLPGRGRLICFLRYDP